MTKEQQEVDIVAEAQLFCVMAIEAVEMLRARGFQAIRLDDGVPEWRACGYSVAVGEKP